MLKAAELGAENAQEYLVRLYSGYDNITEPNYKEAFKWIEVLVKKVLYPQIQYGGMLFLRQGSA